MINKMRQIDPVDPVKKKMNRIISLRKAADIIHDLPVDKPSEKVILICITFRRFTMLMKVFNKGQVVIPAAIRKELGIEIGDMLDVIADTKEKCVKLKRAGEMKSEKLAGSLSRYNRRKRFPSRKEIKKALAEGMTREN